MRVVIIIAVIVMTVSICAADDDQSSQAQQPTAQKAQGLDMVSDTVASVFDKANALLSGNLEVTMSKEKDKAAAQNNFERNAMGQKVPKATAVKSGGSLHNDQPL